MTPIEVERSPLAPRLRATIVAVGATGAALSVGSLAIFGVKWAPSVAIGAILATGNLWVLARFVGALFPKDGRRASQAAAGWGLLAGLKMLGLFGAVWLLMRYEIAAPLALLAGFAALPIGIAIGSVVSDRSALEG